MKTTSNRTPKDLTVRDLIEQESIVGATLFEESLDGTQQSFYNLNKNEWVWYQTNPTWDRPITTRFEVQADCILKIQDTITLEGESRSGYTRLVGQELRNFVAMTKEYHDRVIEHVYASTEPKQTQSRYGMAA